MTSPRKPVVLVICRDYPPFGGATSSASPALVARLNAAGHAVEVIAPSDGAEEFVHLDLAGNLVHRVSADRGYCLRVARAVSPGLDRVRGLRDLGFAARTAEKAFELAQVWNRRIVRVEGAPRAQALLAELVGGVRRRDREAELASGVAPLALPPPEVRSIDVVICTYNRHAELLVAIDSAVIELAAIRKAGLEARLVVVYQNPGLPDRIRAARPALDGTVCFLECSPPSLTRARNLAVRSSQADLLVFIDDDVRLDPGFLEGYLSAARRFPEAVGFAGRVSSPGEPGESLHRAIGQIRPSGEIVVHLNSADRRATYAPQTPMGANMAFRRPVVSAMFGDAWFDETLRGSAIREESTLALAIARAGRYLVFVPDASLHHFESVSGGCDNRARRSWAQRLDHATLEMLFLRRLHAASPLLNGLAAARLAIRDVRAIRGLARRTAHAGMQLGAFVRAGRLAARREARELSVNA